MKLTLTEMEKSGKIPYFPGQTLHKQKETVVQLRRPRRGVEARCQRRCGPDVTDSPEPDLAPPWFSLPPLGSASFLLGPSAWLDMTVLTTWETGSVSFTMQNNQGSLGLKAKTVLDTPSASCLL